MMMICRGLCMKWEACIYLSHMTEKDYLGEIYL